MGPLAHEDLNPEIYSPDPELSEIRPGFELKSFSIFFPGKLCLSSLVWLLHRNIRTLCGCPGITRMCSTVRSVWHGQANGNALRQNKSAPPLQLRWYHQYPLLQYLRQQIQAGFLPQASTAALAKDFPTLAHTVWSSGWQQKLLQRGCNWGTSHLDLSKLWEIFPLSSEEEMLVEYSFLVFRLQAFLWTKDFAQLAV